MKSEMKSGRVYMYTHTMHVALLVCLRIKKKAVLSQGEPHDAAGNLDTCRSLKRHRAVFTALVLKIGEKSRQSHSVKHVYLLSSDSLSDSHSHYSLHYKCKPCSLYVNETYMYP